MRELTTILFHFTRGLVSNFQKLEVCAFLWNSEIDRNYLYNKLIRENISLKISPSSAIHRIRGIAGKQHLAFLRRRKSPRSEIVESFKLRFLKRPRERHLDFRSQKTVLKTTLTQKL